MAIFHEDIVDINLNGGSFHRSFKPTSIGTGDKNANRFGMRVFRDGMPEDLDEVICQAVFQDPMGNNIALTDHGTVSGNLAYVTLPQACYNYEGRFCLAIKLIGGGVTGTMRIVDGVINNTHTGSTVAPTGAVPTYQEVLATYDEAIEAIETVGEMKELILTTLNDTTPTMTWQQGGLRSSDGGAPQQQAANRIRMITYIFSQSMFRVKCESGYRADVYKYTEDRIAGYTEHSGWFTGTKDFPGGYYYRICGAKVDDGNLTPAESGNYAVTVYTATDKTLEKDGVPADAKATGDIFEKALTGVLELNIEKGGWTNKGTKAKSGVKGLRSGQIFELVPGSVLTFYLDEGWTYSIKHGDAANKISPVVSQCRDQTFVVQKKYNAFQFNKFVDGESIELVVSDFDNSVIINTSGDALAVVQDNENHDFPETAGQLNVIYRAYQMSKIVFETKETLPLHSGGSKSVTVRDKPAGTVITGIPYSSMRETMASVPQATSLQAFRTMIENPDSYIYTKHYEQSAPDYDYNSRCYVGAVCSTLVAW